MDLGFGRSSPKPFVVIELGLLLMFHFGPAFILDRSCYESFFFFPKSKATRSKHMYYKNTNIWNVLWERYKVYIEVWFLWGVEVCRCCWWHFHLWPKGILASCFLYCLFSRSSYSYWGLPLFCQGASKMRETWLWKSGLCSLKLCLSAALIVNNSHSDSLNSRRPNNSRQFRYTKCIIPLGSQNNVPMCPSIAQALYCQPQDLLHLQCFSKVRNWFTSELISFQ